MYRLSLAAVLATALSGCGVYVHQPQLETSTGAVKTSFAALTAPAFLAEQKTVLAAHAEREDRAVGAYVLAQRDAKLLEVLRPAPLTPADKRKDLGALVDDELKQTFGRAPTTADLNLLAKASGLMAEVRLQEEIWTRTVRTNAVLYTAALETANADIRRAHGGRPGPAPALPARPVDCAKTTLDTPTEPAAEPGKSYWRLAQSCVALNGVLAFRDATGQDGSGLAALLNGAGGSLKETLGALAESRARQAAAQTEAAQLKTRIQALTKQSTEPGDSQQAQFRQDLEAVGKALKSAKGIAKQAGLEDLAATLEDATAVALKDEEASDSTLAARSAIALGLIDASSGLYDAYQAKPAIDRGNAALIGLARIKHDLGMANLDAALEVQKRANLEAQLAVLLTKARHLATARHLLDSRTLALEDGWADLAAANSAEDRVAASEALGAYVAAWDDGEAPFQVLRYRSVQAQRMAGIDRAIQAEADYRATLKPAIDQLADYGKGGIKEETLVNLLGQLGIAAAILEK